MTHRLRSFVALTALGLIVPLTGGCQKAVPPAAAATGGPASPGVDRVTVGKPVRKTLTLSTAQPGQIEPFEEAPLFAKVAGFVEKVLVDIGDTVDKDQPLVEISIPEMHDDLAQKDALVRQSEAELKQAEVSIVGAKAAVRSAEAHVAQSEAGIVRTDAEYQRWDAEFKRIKDLADKRAVTEKLVDETRSQLQAAEAAKRESAAAVLSAKANLDEAAVQVQKAEADLGAASARLSVAKANLARTKTLLDYTVIKAPFAGVVTRRLVNTGHYVSPPGGPTSQPLLVVCRTDIVRIFVDVPELEAERVNSGKDGDKAEVRVQALGNRAFSALVTRSSWSLDPSNRSLRTEIDIPNADGVLRPGMYATAAIILEQRPDVVVLPVAAVVREGPDAFCCRVVSGKVERHKIEVGLRSGAEIEIRSGLSPDQEVVLANAAALKPGQAVEVVTPEKK